MFSAIKYAVDKLSLWLTRNGLFSINSAYALDLNRIRQVQRESSNSKAKEEFWKSLWRLNIQGATKKFMWRMCHDILSTKMNLVKMKISDQVKCLICNLEEELSHMHCGNVRQR